MTSFVVFEAVGQSVIVSDLDGVVIYANNAAEQLYGYPRSDLVGSSLLPLLVRAEDLEIAAEVISELSAGRSWTGDFTLRHRDGTHLRVRTTDSPLLDSQGNVVGIIGISEDVTAQRMRAAVVEDRERRLHLALQAGGFGTWEWDQATGVTVMDPRLEALLGLAPGAFDGTFDMWVQLLHPDERGEILARLHRAIADGGTYVVEHRVDWPDGTTHWLEGLGQVTFDAAGNVTGTIGCTRDVTERVGTERQLRELIEEQGRLLGRLADVAAELQAGLAPHDVPVVAGVELAALYEPGGDETERIGGDWFDAIPLDDGRVALIVGDVMGRGIRAATTMTGLRAAVRAYVSDDPSPSSVLDRLDRLMRQPDVSVDEFVTLFYGVLDPSTGELRYLNAGHLRPLVVCDDSPAHSIESSPAVPLGLTEARGADVVSHLRTGDLLLIYTDGLVERPGADLDVTIDRLASVARPLGRETLPQLTRRVIDSMHTDGVEDDVTLLAVRISAG
jgi:PAS domain S-box-containing protein